ncbi:hypothetical protein ILUMI_09445 [Ignelater luminosus]|uniref:Reverse transcriptase domain-containing protein n=1 Tax=Ignelater luminosus TaxID=2038154 RepID=A0A8K0GEI6_IGNLU|nr:hypothetical protein ILUMI_09445 [Ignelater luminosus]
MPLNSSKPKSGANGRNGLLKGIAHEKWGSNKRSGRRNNSVYKYDNEIISKKWLDYALKRLKLGKPDGHNLITPEMINYLGNEREQMLLRLINKVRIYKVLPEDWKLAIILPIFKNGSVPCKIYKQNEAKLGATGEPQLKEEQCGFRKGRGTYDLIFKIRQLIEKLLERDIRIYVCFVDLTKAFESISRPELWENSKKAHRNEWGHYHMQAVNMNILAFADDIVLYAKSEKDLQYNLEVLIEELRKKNPAITAIKTKMVVVANDLCSVNISINDEEMQQVTSFKYLGVITNQSGDKAENLKTRIKANNKMFGVL